MKNDAASRFQNKIKKRKKERRGMEFEEDVRERGAWEGGVVEIRKTGGQ